MIENVVYAHDAERKWIQNHPVVLYECYILNHIFQHLNNRLNTQKSKLFSYDSLTMEGHVLKNGIKVSLLCDDDIIYLMKNVESCKSELALELDLEQTRDLIGRAGYALTNSSKFDVIIMYFIRNHNYNLFDINAALFEFDQSLPVGLLPTTALAGGFEVTT